MFDHLFIAEKNSLAVEVAEARAQQLGVSMQKSRTHIVVGSDAVTWLSGHMYENAPPEAYDPKYQSWTIAHLPIVPDRWKLVVGKDRDGKQKTDKVREVGDLIKQAKRIVNVGDPGREGQLLVDEVLHEVRRDPFADDVFRLWITDLSASKKVEALKAMFPNAQKRTLSESALCRQRADWLHGMNMTRLYTGLVRRAGGTHDKPISVGRVQTPTLRLVVDRDREIARFKAVDHYLPTGRFKHANGEFSATLVLTPDHEGLDSEGRMVDKAVAQRIAEKIKGKTGPVESFEIKKKSKTPPLPYSLTTLEKECSAKFGFGVEKTDSIAQSLYETHKIASYPRTDCRHLPTGVLKEEAQGILDNLGGARDFAGIVANCNRNLVSGAWNDAKVAASDAGHFALMPTSEATADKIARLDADELKVFTLIAKSFLAQFYPDHRWDSTTAVIAIEGERFKATGRVVTEQGWKVVYGAVEKEDDEDEDEQSLPRMAKGDPVTATQTAVDSKRTTPPSHFTEGTLVEAMENIHRFVPDGEVKKKLRENAGIGTTATRSSILKTLKARLFLTPKGKFIVSTALGQSIIDVLDPKLKDPALTALWETQLDRVNKGEIPMDRFIEVLVQEIRGTVERLADSTVKVAGAGEALPGSGETCPSCQKGKLRTRVVGSGPSKGKKFLSCDAYNKDDPNSCKFTKWPDEPRKMIPKLDGDGSDCPACGKGKLVTRAVLSGPHKGKRFLSCDAYSKDDPNSCRHTAWEAQKVEALPGDGTECPTCKKGRLVTRMVQKGEHKGKRFLSCSEGRRDDPKSCQYFQWPKREIVPLPGDGETCPACRNGKMRTRELFQGENKGKKFLSCDAYDKDDPRSCKHAIWPDRDREVKGTPSPTRTGGKLPPARPTRRTG